MPAYTIISNNKKEYIKEDKMRTLLYDQMTELFSNQRDFKKEEWLYRLSEIGKDVVATLGIDSAAYLERYKKSMQSTLAREDIVVNDENLVQTYFKFTADKKTEDIIKSDALSKKIDFGEAFSLKENLHNLSENLFIVKKDSNGYTHLFGSRYNQKMADWVKEELISLKKKSAGLFSHGHTKESYIDSDNLVCDAFWEKENTKIQPLQLYPIGMDDWHRELYKDVKTKMVYVEVDGAMHSRSKMGEPSFPLSQPVDIIKNPTENVENAPISRRR